MEQTEDTVTMWDQFEPHTNPAPGAQPAAPGRSEKPKEVTSAKDVALDESFQIAPKNFHELFYMATTIFKSGLCPSSYKGPAQVVIAIQTAKERGIDPLRLIQNSYVVNNILKVYGSFPKTEVTLSGLCAEYREFLIDKDYNEINLKNKNLDAEPFAGICYTKRADNGREEETYFTIQDAERAGLKNNPKKEPWQKYLKRMLLARARSLNLEYNFGDVLGGLIDTQGMEPPPREVKDVPNESINDYLENEESVEFKNPFQKDEKMVRNPDELGDATKTFEPEILPPEGRHEDKRQR